MLICSGGGGGGGGGGGVDFAVGSQVETPLVVFLVETLLDLAVTLFETPVVVVVVVVTLLEGPKWWWWCYFSRSQLVLSLTVTAFPAAGPTGYVPTGGLHHHQNNPRAHKFCKISLFA